MNTRIIIDTQAFIRETNFWFDRLSQAAKKLGTGRFETILRRWRGIIEERLNQPYTIVVCGEFNRGKSSLINTILGEDAVPVDMLPETMTYNMISYGPHSNEAILSGGRRLVLSDDEIRRENLIRIEKEYSTSIRQLILHRTIPVLKDIRIIDTPGMNESPDPDGNLMKQTLEQADALIYVLTADSPLSLTEQSFLRNIVLPRRTMTLMLVCNKTDLVDTKQLSRLEEAFSRRFERFLPGQKVYFLSAVAERMRQEDATVSTLPDQEILNGLFDTFRLEFEQEVNKRKDLVRLSRAEHLINACITELEEEIAVIRLGVDSETRKEMDREQEITASLQASNEILERLSESLTSKIHDMETRAQGEMAQVFIKMKGDIETLADVDEADIEKYYPFYCTDIVRDVLTAQMERDEEEIFDMIREMPELEFLHLPHIPVPDFCFDLDCRIWTKGDTMGYLSGWFARGTMMTMLTTYMSGFFREREVSNQTVTILEKIRDIYPLFWKSTSKNIFKVYDGFKKDLLKQITIFVNEKTVQLKERQEEADRLQKLSFEERSRINEIANALLEELKDMKKEFSSGLTADASRDWL